VTPFTRLLSIRSRWRAQSRLARGVGAYVAFALTLTALAAILDASVAPPTGLVRTVYAQANFSGQPLFQDRTADISLAFLDDDSQLPRRFFSVRWTGFWFLPEPQTIDLYAGADDQVEVFVDRELVLTRNFAVGSHTTSRRMTFAAGPHELEIRYQQSGGSLMLSISQARAGETPTAFVPTRLFPARPDLADYWLASGLRWLYRLVAAVWLVPAALAVLVLAVRSEVRAWTPLTLREFRRRLSRVAFPALLGPFVLFLVGPHTVYEGNAAEFNVTFSRIAWPWLLAAVGAGWAIFFGVGGLVSLLSDRLSRAYVALLAAFGVLLWIQGTFLVADYGPLYGEGLDLNRFAWRAPYEAGLWIALAALAITFARAVSTIAPLASQLFIALQLAVLAVSTIWPAAEARSDADGWRQPPEEMYHLSGGRNVIHVVLDGFLSEIFGEVVDQERASIDRDFSGFVFFADHLGAFPTTRASMPAMLAGVAYRNEMPFDQFFRNTIGTLSVSTVLGTHGYALHSITFDGRDHPPASVEGSPEVVRYTIPTPYASYRDYVIFAALQLFDLSLFRQVPQGLKSYVYNDEDWFVQSRSFGLRQTQRARNVRPSNHAAFLDEFASRVTVAQDDPVYTFIHVAMPHPPIAVDAGCSFLGGRRLTRASYTGQAQCALRVVRRLLDRLRALGIYDQSVVVLSADHGWRVPRSDHPFRGLSGPAGDMAGIVLSSMPLLAVKPAAATGPIRVSYAPTTMTDVPATIVDLLGLPNPFPGESALRIDADAARPRTYAFHSWENADWGRPYLDVLHVFSVNGRVLDPSAWSYKGDFRPRSATSEAGTDEPPGRR
jgi:hypothetical protein